MISTDVQRPRDEPAGRRVARAVWGSLPEMMEQGTRLLARRKGLVGDFEPCSVVFPPTLKREA